MLKLPKFDKKKTQKKLKNLRTRLGYTQKEMAEALGVGLRTYIEAETDGPKAIGLYTLAIDHLDYALALDSPIQQTISKADLHYELERNTWKNIQEIKISIYTRRKEIGKGFVKIIDRDSIKVVVNDEILAKNVILPPELLKENNITEYNYLSDDKSMVYINYAINSFL